MLIIVLLIIKRIQIRSNKHLSTVEHMKFQICKLLSREKRRLAPVIRVLHRAFEMIPHL